MTSPAESETMTAVELGERFKLEPDEGRRLLEVAVKMGILIPVGGDKFEAATSARTGTQRTCVRGEGLPAISPQPSAMSPEGRYSPFR